MLKIILIINVPYYTKFDFGFSKISHAQKENLNEGFHPLLSHSYK